MWALKPVSCPLLFPGCYGFFLLHIYTSFFPTTKHHYIFPFSNAEKTFLCWQNYEVIYSVKSWVVKSARKTNSNSQQQTLIEILWSNLTLEQNSSWIWLSAGTPMLVLSRPEYSELALECRQKVKSRNYFDQIQPQNFYQWRRQAKVTLAKTEIIHPKNVRA